MVSGRFGFIGSFAFNNIEKNPQWLDASRSCIEFIEACSDPEDGRMYFEVMADGTPLRKRRYVFSECFAAIAMSEYALASGDMTYAAKASPCSRRYAGLFPPRGYSPRSISPHSPRSATR